MCLQYDNVAPVVSKRSNVPNILCVDSPSRNLAPALRKNAPRTTRPQRFRQAGQEAHHHFRFSTATELTSLGIASESGRCGPKEPCQVSVSLMRKSAQPIGDLAAAFGGEQRNLARDAQPKGIKQRMALPGFAHHQGQMDREGACHDALRQGYAFWCHARQFVQQQHAQTGTRPQHASRPARMGKVEVLELLNSSWSKYRQSAAGHGPCCPWR
jgi:hypothetical protein